MIWHDWGAFFAMGGYALYVWGAVIVCAITLAGELIALNLRRNTLLAARGDTGEPALPESSHPANRPAAGR